MITFLLYLGVWLIAGIVIFALLDNDGRLAQWFNQDPIKPIGQILVLLCWPVIVWEKFKRR